MACGCAGSLFFGFVSFARFKLLCLRDFVAGVLFEIFQCHNTHDAHIFVHNGQIFEMMLAHNFPCLIQRLIFEAIICFFYHDSTNKRRRGIMAKAGSLPLRVLALHGPNQMIT